MPTKLRNQIPSKRNGNYIKIISNRATYGEGKTFTMRNILIGYIRSQSANWFLQAVPQPPGGEGGKIRSPAPTTHLLASSISSVTKLVMGFPPYQFSWFISKPSILIKGYPITPTAKPNKYFLLSLRRGGTDEPPQ